MDVTNLTQGWVPAQFATIGAILSNIPRGMLAAITEKFVRGSSHGASVLVASRCYRLP